MFVSFSFVETLPTPLLLEYPVKKSMYNNSLCKYVVKTFPDGLYSLRSNFLDELAQKRLLRGLTVLVTYEQSLGKVKMPQLIAAY